MSLPTSITGVQRTKGQKPVVATIPLPAVEGKKALVKMIAAPINPSDVMWLKGQYPANKADTAFSGLEGVGTVVAVGPDAPAELKGKRVCFFVGGDDQGTWSDYVVVGSESVIPVPESVDDEQAASALVNPLTVELFLEKCEKEGHTALVHGAASSALGLMLVAAAKKAGKVKIINLVRRAENVKLLQSHGAEHIVDITADKWEEEFSRIAATVKPSVFFDPIAGATGSKVISLMPNDSVTYNYGALDSAAQYTIGVPDLLFKGKVIRGLWLSVEMKTPGLAPTLIGRALGNLASKTYQTTIYKKFPLEKFEEALKEYEENASKGKILLVPGSA